MTTTPRSDPMTLMASEPRPGWELLDAARSADFTGELAVTAPIAAHVYFDNGVAYHAERPTDPSLCERLLEAGVITPAQVSRGVVRVGNIENLGRLFDRDPSVDRDAVMVVVELATDGVVTAIANQASIEVTATAYRHHASGVHRWFVAPDDPMQLAPVGEVAQLDDSITSNLPTLPAPVPTNTVPVTPPERLPRPGPLTVLGPEANREALDDAMLHSMLDDAAGPTNSEPAPADRPSLEVPRPVAPPATAPLQPDSVADFQIVWPDGTEQGLPQDVSQSGGDRPATSDSATTDEFAPPTIDSSAEAIYARAAGAAQPTVTTTPDPDPNPGE